MPYKILSLDGGGSWALIQARVLLDIYGNIKGHELLKQFDMAIANSGGSLVLACLCNNMSLTEIISVFNTANKRKKVFSSLLPGERLLKQIIRVLSGIGPQYSTRRKIKGLCEVLKQYDPKLSPKPIVETFLNEIPAIIGKNYNAKDVQLVITGFDFYRERVSFFRSNAQSNTDKFTKKFFQITLGHAIHASSNAPVNYFDRPAKVFLELLTSSDNEKDKRSSWFWDGAVAGFNNPVLAGLVEAVTNNNGTDLKDFHILSIGTGQSRKAILTDYKTSTNGITRDIYLKNIGKPFVEGERSFSLITDFKKVAGSILADPPDSATFIAYCFLDPSLKNGTANLIRINPCINPINKNGLFDYPNAYKNDQENFIRLMEMDMDAVNDEDVELINTLCDRFIVNDHNAPCLQNQLIRGEFDTDHIGYAKYWEAKERWLQIK